MQQNSKSWAPFLLVSPSLDPFKWLTLDPQGLGYLSPPSPPRGSNGSVSVRVPGHFPEAEVNLEFELGHLRWIWEVLLVNLQRAP